MAVLAKDECGRVFGCAASLEPPMGPADALSYLSSSLQTLYANRQWLDR